MTKEIEIYVSTDLKESHQRTTSPSPLAGGETEKSLMSSGHQRRRAGALNLRTRAGIGEKPSR